MLKKIILQGEQKKVLFLPPKNPIQIKGVAGSGKTTVALYRAKHLLETQANLFKETKIVIFTYNKALSEYIKAIKPLINGGYQKDSFKIKPKTKDGLNDIEVINFHKWAYKFIGIEYGQVIKQKEQINIINEVLMEIRLSSKKEDYNIQGPILNKNTRFFQEEISWMKGKLFKVLPNYLQSPRTGRGTSNRVMTADKLAIWRVYEKYNKRLKIRGKVDFDDFAILVLKKIQNDRNFSHPFSHIIIDEAQDLNKAQILAISKLVDPETNSLSIIADAAQRIYKSGFTWNEVGINVTGGRTIEFKINYRNTVHIANAATSLLINENDKREFTKMKSALKGGEKPIVGYYSDFYTQLNNLNEKLKILNNNNSIISTVVLHRNSNGVDSINAFLNNNGFQTELIRKNKYVNYQSKKIKICTMSSIKGLEFNNVFILDLNDDIIPYPEGFTELNDEFHISTERRLLYTCMTRARKNLYLFSSNIQNPSRFLNEIREDYLTNITLENSINRNYLDDLPFS